MTHGRVTAPQMEDKVQIVRVMTHGRVTAPQMEGLLMWVMSHGVKGQGQTVGPLITSY